MLKKLFSRQKLETVMGHRIAEPRYTWQAGFWIGVYVLLPLFLLCLPASLLVVVPSSLVE